MLDKHLIAEVKPKTAKEYIISGDGYRISVLTPQLLRVETGEFTDEATQSVWFRDFDKPKFAQSQKGAYLYIETTAARFCFNKNSRKITEITFIKDNRTVKCSNKHNLKGTRRTLDFTIGRVRLGMGLMSKTGISVLDDSSSLLLMKGQAVPRFDKATDLYIFAYNRDYRKCLADFFKLTGEVPLIPRYALGNWWSRYRAYTQQEYTALMERFKAEDIPVTVATIDMDWHWVDVNKKFKLNINKIESPRPGWTGYSWNTELFPDYKGFLKYLRDNNMRTTLNLHPSDGVRWFEDMYEEMAEAMGIDPASKAPIKFDITDRTFISEYFKVLHNPYEDEGVDFWWMDWQQGKKTAVKGLDPLWPLNHYHFLNSQRNNKRPLILSRYAGVGSHRYPLGFSGDTHMYWCSLKFQPYFTANAANIGYTWWSHDIGGHMLGKKSNEMYLRWLQFGIFSPINRLHSTSHDLQGKEPWNYSDVTERYTKEALTLRHRLIPYIYSMNYKTHKEGIPLCEPMYYRSTFPEAYEYNNQYYFGSELIVAPVVTRLIKPLQMAKTAVWLPEGRWTDIFTGRIYNGGKVINMFRGVSSIPALAKEGAIIPLSGDSGNKWQNPDKLTVHVYRGEGGFELYEDDGETMDYKDGRCAFTNMRVNEKDGN
ncbi:MAG: glycoside hydrolase family 31 protein, partial [Clostridia bacterium]|nr:glycoside hydrolase family 31 protein [Clostridia bacterium]